MNPIPERVRLAVPLVCFREARGPMRAILKLVSYPLAS